MRCPPARGRIKGLRSLGSTGEFSMGFSPKQKKPLVYLVGGIDQRRNDSGLALLSSAPNAAHCCQANRSSTSWLRKRGSDFQGRLCLVVRRWELAAFFVVKKEKIMIVSVLSGLAIFVLLVKLS